MERGEVKILYITKSEVELNSFQKKKKKVLEKLMILFADCVTLIVHHLNCSQL